MEAPTTGRRTVRPAGAYIDVDGVRTYYEVSGDGDPLILLHGGMCTAETWDAQSPALAARYRVHVPERFGHGRTPDIDGPITYENMAQHTIGFMEALALESAHLVGWSDGALVGLLVALRRPSLVRKLVLIDQFVTLDGAPPWYLPFVNAMAPDNLPPALVDTYAALSPDGGDHFPVAFGKLHRIFTTPTGVELADLANISAPTLVIAADSGAITLDHLAGMRHALPDPQIAVVPGATHLLCQERPHIVNQLILDFLAGEPAPKMSGHEG